MICCSAATTICILQSVVYVLWRQCAAAHAPAMQARLQPQTWGEASAQLRFEIRAECCLVARRA